MSSSTTLEPAGTIKYHEPSLPALLTLISFLYFLQVARNICDTVLGAGLLGEITIGVIYGPLAKILNVESQETFIAIGYIGLILIVFEGGLTLNLGSFVPLLPLALFSALIGILLPLAFTFALFSAPTLDYPPIQAFTAGSALASTSLGTTFFVLKSAGQGLDATRIAQVLKGAALVDDIIALVLLSVISSLAGEEGGGGGSLGWTIGRPIVASIAMCSVTPLVILYILRPVFRLERLEKWVEKGGQSMKLFLGVVVLSAFLAIAYYAGTTVLLGAFLGGVTVPFLSPSISPSSPTSFLQTYDTLLVPIQNHILVPFFFASIGYSIPFLQLWTGRVIWRGIVYSLLMVLGKLSVGVCVVGFDLVSGGGKNVGGETTEKEKEELNSTESVVRDNTDAERCLPLTTTSKDSKLSPSSSSGSFKSDTLPASVFLGLALVARGEIGILVLQVAYNASTEENPVLTTEPYLIAIWAVALCTIVGPVGFARLVRSEWGRGVLRGRWG